MNNLRRHVNIENVIGVSLECFHTFSGPRIVTSEYTIETGGEKSRRIYFPDDFAHATILLHRVPNHLL